MNRIFAATKRERVGEREPGPGRPALRPDDALHRERAGHQDYREDRQARRDFITDDLRRRADSANQRPFVVGGPSRHQHADHGQRGHRGHVENPDIKVGEDQVADENGITAHGSMNASITRYGASLNSVASAFGRDEVFLAARASRRRRAIAGSRCGPTRLGPHARLDPRPHPALHPTDDAGERKRHAEEHHRAEDEDEQRVDQVARRMGAERRRMRSSC